VRRRVATLAQFTGLVAGAFGLTTQFSISIPAAMETGRSLPGALVWFFSYFTILTNMLAVCVHIGFLWAGRTGRDNFLSSALVKGNTVVAIAVVGLVYHFLLAGLWAPKGLFHLCDILLHYVAPAAFVLWWLTEGADGRTRWRDPFLWLIYPLVYSLYALARGAATGDVPYPFLDAANGYAAVLASMAGLLLMFMILGGLAVLTDHRLGCDRR